MDFKIKYYRDGYGNDPIHEFLLELSRINLALYNQTFRGLEKLKNRSYHKEPLSKYIEPGLWELRIRAGTDILRILYTFDKGQIIVLLHGFIKKQEKTPAGDLELARKRLRVLKILERKDEKNKR